jgi:hypothetical protein
MRQIVRCLLHFLAFGFFFKVLILTLVKYLVHSLVQYMVGLVVSLVWRHLGMTSNIQPHSEITSLSYWMHRPIKRGVSAHVKTLEKTKSEERHHWLLTQNQCLFRGLRHASMCRHAIYFGLCS